MAFSWLDLNCVRPYWRGYVRWKLVLFHKIPLRTHLNYRAAILIKALGTACNLDQIGVPCHFLTFEYLVILAAIYADIEDLFLRDHALDGHMCLIVKAWEYLVLEELLACVGYAPYHRGPLLDVAELWLTERLLLALIQNAANLLLKHIPQHLISQRYRIILKHVNSIGRRLYNIRRHPLRHSP